MIRKILVYLIVLVLHSSVASAAATGAGKTVAQNEFAVGFDYNKIFAIEMEPEDKVNYDKGEISDSDQFYGTVTYGVFNNGSLSADVSGKIGMADLTVKTVDTGLFGTEQIHYDQGLLWGVGGKIANKLQNNFTISFHGQYTRWQSDLDRITFDGETAFNVSGSDKARVSEFQAAVLLTYEKKHQQTGLTFVPYAGPYLAFNDVEIGEITYRTNSVTSGPLDASLDSPEDPYGYILGVEIYGLNDHLKLIIEARFRYEQALTLSVHYNF